MTDIAILDFGSQYANLICALLTDLGITNELLPTSTSIDSLKEYRGLILSGGPASVHAPDSPQFLSKIFDIHLPILGICYGHQLMAQAMGGRVVPASSSEYGRAELEVLSRESVFSDFDAVERVWMSHSDTVEQAPPGFVIAGKTKTCPVAAMYNKDKNRFGVQFHPEVAQTEIGPSLLRRFAIDICGCQPEGDVSTRVEKLKSEILLEVGDRNVFLLLSGGVDSSVAFVLLARALGKERVYGLHIDTGLLREGETAQLVETLERIGLRDRLRIVDASAEFFQRLSGLQDPEAKRKTIAVTFLDVKNKALEDFALDSNKWLMGQGTIYTDLITSGLTKNSQTIKTHHNSLLEERRNLSIIEPLKKLYKHQVRSLGVELGLPHELVWREPYPGPGNGVRILGKVTRPRANLQRQIDVIVTSILRKHGYHETLFQGFPVMAIVSDFDKPLLHDKMVGTVSTERLEIVKTAETIIHNRVSSSRHEPPSLQIILLPLKTVGIKGDNRSFSAPLMIRAIAASTWGRLDYQVLEDLSNEITNKIDGVTRVVYDITSARPEETGWDKLVFLRLITSREAMTADWAKVDYQVLDELSNAILSTSEIDRVMLDVTQKPPGMVEWE